jgi:hypothetical protein
VSTSTFEVPQYAAREFVCGSVLLRATNEFGLMDLELGAVESSSSLRSASSFRDILDPPALGQWNLGMGGGAKFVDERWEEVMALLAPGVWPTTVQRINEFSRHAGKLN